MELKLNQVTGAEEQFVTETPWGAGKVPLTVIMPRPQMACLASIFTPYELFFPAIWEGHRSVLLQIPWFLTENASHE